MLNLKKDDKVTYLGNFPYKLGNGQEVYVYGEELIINKDVIVQKKYFEKIIEVKKEKEEQKQKVQKKDKK